MKSSLGYQFEAIFIPQKEGGFTVEVLDLPGCVSEGDTIQEAENNIKEAIGLYLETLKERGLPLPERKQEGTLRMQITMLPVTKLKKIHA